MENILRREESGSIRLVGYSRLRSIGSVSIRSGALLNRIPRLSNPSHGFGSLTFSSVMFDVLQKVQYCFCATVVSKLKPTGC